VNTYAAIDCGTNSIRLLISRVDSEGILTELHRDNIIVRLGQDVDATGRFANAALERVDAALATYTDKMVEYGVTDVIMGATSATRDAANREDFFELTRRHLGRIRAGGCAEVVSGVHEAELSFAGAVADLGELGQAGGVLVVDLGGGSTEFVVDAGHGGVYSTNMGCVRLTERFLHSDPPVPPEISSAADYVGEQISLAAREVDFSAVTTFVGVAGSITTLTAVHLGLDSYDPEQTHMASLSLAGFRETARAVLAETVDQRRAYPVMHPGRADVIGGGCIVVDAVASLLLDQGVERIIVSEKDILDGLLAEVITRNS